MIRTSKASDRNERKIILRVLHYFEEEKRLGKLGMPVDQALKRTCVATGVSLRTVNRIKSEGKKLLEEFPPLPPMPSSDQEDEEDMLTDSSSLLVPRYAVEQPPEVKIEPAHNSDTDESSAFEESLKQILDRFHRFKQVPSIQKVLAIVKSELSFQGEKEMLREILIERLGCTFVRSPDMMSKVRQITDDSDLEEENEEEKPEVKQEVWVDVKEEIV